MATSIKVCFAPGADLSAADAQFFGSEVAEPAIILDYLSVTQGGLLNDERDWWDEGPLAGRVASHLKILDTRHQLKDAQRTLVRTLPVPDILTWRGVDREVLRVAAPFSTFSRTPRVIAPRGSRHEFYEIKPRNKKGQIDGRDKVDRLRDGYQSAALPYAPGTTYPDVIYQGGVAHIPLLGRGPGHVNQWRSAVKVAMARENIASIEVSLEVSRKGIKDAGRMPHGLLLYRVCVAIAVIDDKTDEQAIRIARELVHAWTVVAPINEAEEIRLAVRRAFLGFEAETITRGDGPPRELIPQPHPYTPVFPMVNVEYVEMWPSLRDTRDALRDGLISRGMGLPGEEYILACDDVFFAVLVEQAMPLLRLLRVITTTPPRWYGYLKDYGALGLLDVAVEVDQLLQQASVFGLHAAKEFKEWVAENPGKATVVILVVLVVSLATLYVAAPLVAAELGLGAASFATASGTSVVNGTRLLVTELAQIRRVGLQAQLIEQFWIRQGQRAILAEGEALARQQAAAMVARHVAAAHTAARLKATEAAILSQAGTQFGRLATGAVLKKMGPQAAAIASGAVVLVSGSVAYAGKRTAGHVNPTGEPQAVQLGFARLFKADKQPPTPAWLANLDAPKPNLRLGLPFDAARVSAEAAATLKEGGPAKVEMRYLGRIRLT